MSKINPELVSLMVETLNFQTLFKMIETMSDRINELEESLKTHQPKEIRKTYLRDLPPLPLADFKLLIPTSFIKNLDDKLAHLPV